MKNENLCVVTSPYWHYTLDYAMNSISSVGFRNIEFWAASPHYCYMDYTPQERESRRIEILEMMKKYGLKMPVFYPEQMNKYTLNIASADPYIKKNSMDRVLEYLEDAARFGAGAMILSTGWQHLDAPAPEKRARSVAAIRTVADRAELLGLTVLIEAVSPILGSFAWDLPSLRGLLTDVDRKNVKACLDLASILGSGSSVKEWFDSLRGMVGHIHFSDCGGQIPGTNGGDVAGALRVLDNLGYNGLLSLNLTFRDCCLVADRAVFASGKWLEHQGF